MKMTVLALTAAMMLAGTAVSTASAHDGHQIVDRAYHYDRTVQYDDRYDDRYDNRYDDRYDSRYDDRYEERYDNRSDRRYEDRYDTRYDNRSGYTQTRVMNDRDCDGVPNRYDTQDQRNARDRDCDGIRNRNDGYDDRARMGARFSGPRYVQPRGYSYSRWNVGSRLPTGYYGNSYYVDYRPYNLPAPRNGYRWNRVGNDVYMVSTRDGLIANVIYNLFR